VSVQDSFQLLVGLSFCGPQIQEKIWNCARKDRAGCRPEAICLLSSLAERPLRVLGCRVGLADGGSMPRWRSRRPIEAGAFGATYFGALVMEVLFGGLIILIGFGSALAYIALQLYTGIRWRGGWRIVALLPLLLMIPVFVITALAYAQQSNLWPILLIFAAPLGTGYLVILMVIRRSVTQPPYK